MCSNASITEILGINDNNLVILGNEKENIKGIEYTVLKGKLSYRPACCPKCGIVNENYDITKNGSQTVKILFNRVNTNPMILMVKKLRKYVVNSLKYDYMNAIVDGKNNKIKVIKRVSYGYRSFRNFKARIMLMERYKIQKGNIHSYKFAMDAAA